RPTATRILALAARVEARHGISTASTFPAGPDIATANLSTRLRFQRDRFINVYRFAINTGWNLHRLTVTCTIDQGLQFAVCAFFVRLGRLKQVRSLNWCIAASTAALTAARVYNIRIAAGQLCRGGLLIPITITVRIRPRR